MKSINILSLLFVLILVACGGEENPAPVQEDVCDKITVPGKTACIPFSGNVDEKISGKTGDAIGAVLTSDRRGNSNSAYTFDGIDDYVQIENPPINLGGSFSVLIWAMIDDASPSSGKIRFMDSRINSFNPNNSLNIYLDLGLDQLTIAGIGISRFEFEYETGNWFQLAVVYDEIDAELEVYVNGIALPEGDQGFSGFTYGGEPLIIGARSDLKEFFPGKIDDISFFNRDLEESEISSLLFQ